LRDRARAVAQMRAIWHCEIFDTTPVLVFSSRTSTAAIQNNIQRYNTANLSTLGVFNACSTVNRVVLIEAGGFYLSKYGISAGLLILCRD